ATDSVIGLPETRSKTVGLSIISILREFDISRRLPRMVIEGPQDWPSMGAHTLMGTAPIAPSRQPTLFRSPIDCSGRQGCAVVYPTRFPYVSGQCGGQLYICTCIMLAQI